jgi:hypothetical protein
VSTKNLLDWNPYCTCVLGGGGVGAQGRFIVVNIQTVLLESPNDVSDAIL